MGQNCFKSESFDAPKVVPNIQSLGAIEEFDLIIIGGGSGGMACAKEAAEFKVPKILICDYVKPSPVGTTWGLGGTCTNVGCIPKKLMHFAALSGQTIYNLESYGYTAIKAPSDNQITTTVQRAGFDWKKLVDEIQNHIHSINWKNKITLRENNTTYVNQMVEFVDSYTLECLDAGDTRKFVKGKYIVIIAGGRPRYLTCPGGRKEDKICISSDDIFSMTSHPGKVLIVGASYIAVECAGFLHGLGMEVTVMVRTSILRNFDKEMATKIANHLEGIGIKFLKECEPTEIKRIDSNSIQVTGKNKAGTIVKDTYNTVLLAIGRDPCTVDLKVVNAGIKCSDKNQRILVDPSDQTNIKNIFAIGDIADGHMELTPIAIHSGKNLIRRLYDNSKTLTDYVNIPTTVFTPIEYSCIGLSEENAIAKYGNIEVYPKSFLPLQYTLPHQDPDVCYAKLICAKNLNERVVGMHYLGPDAAEVIQGYQIGFHLNATKAHFDALVGVHPSCGELFSVLKIKKSSGHADDSTDC